MTVCVTVICYVPVSCVAYCNCFCCCSVSVNFDINYGLGAQILHSVMSWQNQLYTYNTHVGVQV